MTDQINLNLCLRLPFEKAGVEFNIEVNESGDPEKRARVLPRRTSLRLRRPTVVSVAGVASAGGLGKGIHALALPSEDQCAAHR